MHALLVPVAAACRAKLLGAVAAVVWLFSGVCPQVPIEVLLQHERGTATRVRAFVRFIVFGVLAFDVSLDAAWHAEFFVALGARQGFEAGVCPVVVPCCTQVCDEL